MCTRICDRLHKLTILKDADHSQENRMTQNTIVSMHSFNKCKAINEQRLIANKLPCVDYFGGAVQRGGGCVSWATGSDLLFWVVRS